MVKSTKVTRRYEMDTEGSIGGRTEAVTDYRSSINLRMFLMPKTSISSFFK
jgi:hypothetical protein